MKTLSKEEKDRIQLQAQRNQRTRRKDDVERALAKGDRINRIISVSIIILLAILLSTIGVIIWQDRKIRAEEEKSRYRPETYQAYNDLKHSAAQIEKQRIEALDKLNLDILRNWALIESSQDIARFTEEIEEARSILEWSREQLKMLFKSLYKIFPADSVNERLDSEKLYEELMGRIDVEEERLANEELVLATLHENRGKWRAVKGEVRFSDSKLQKEFDFFCKGPGGETSRWRKDFGAPGVIESAPVALPTAK